MRVSVQEAPGGSVITEIVEVVPVVIVAQAGKVATRSSGASRRLR